LAQTIYRRLRFGYLALKVCEFLLKGFYSWSKFWAHVRLFRLAIRLSDKDGADGAFL
jgi:hypothetical protein